MLVQPVSRLKVNKRQLVTRIALRRGGLDTSREDHAGHSTTEDDW